MLNKNSKTVITQALTRLCGRLNKRKITSGTVEWLDAHLTFDPDFPELDYGKTRPFNKSYAEKEEAWYKSKDLCIFGHDGIEDNRIWSSIATENGYVNSNYGYLVYAERSPGKSQFEYALENLIPDKDGNSGRQSVIYYAGPEMQVWNNDGIHAKHDFTCTFQTQHFIRNWRLEYLITQRSCDLIFGLTYDFYHHCHVYENMLEELKKKYPKIHKGKIYYSFGSLHVYERHWSMIVEILRQYRNGELK